MSGTVSWVPSDLEVASSLTPMEHGVVQCTGNVKEFTCDLFKELDQGRCHGGSVVNLCHLLFGPVVGRRVA